MNARCRVAILGLNIFARKNAYQTVGMAAHGYTYDVLSTQREVHELNGEVNARLLPLRPDALGRLLQVWRYLRSHRNELHHAEVYVGGRFAAAYVLLARLAGIPTLIAERGDLFMSHNRSYGLVTRNSMALAYRLADAVWYRELYAAELLAKMGVQRRYLLANSVPMPPALPTGPRDIDLLWVNRFKAPRRPEFMAEALAAVLPRKAATARILGTIANGPPETDAMQRQFQQAVAGVPGITLEEFSDPASLFARSRFFLLPADVTFANFALLEAMAAGVIPIISDVPGTELLVEDGASGLVVEHSAAGFQSGIERALAMTDTERQRLSAGAHAMIRDRYSVDAWCVALSAIYATLRLES
jgi:glycosyltransferase involved in cell wall biosynthesis